MYLELPHPARRSTMVIMEIPNIDCSSLRALLEGSESGCLVLDCRSFFSFSSSHISGSTNVRFSAIVRRRARGGLGLEHIVPNEDTRSRLLSGEYRTVVLLDDRSLDFSQVKKDGTLMLAVTALSRNNPRGANVFFLKGRRHGNQNTFCGLRGYLWLLCPCKVNWLLTLSCVYFSCCHVMPGQPPD